MYAFARTQTTITSILDAFTATFGLFVSVGVGIALFVFIWGIVTFIVKSGDDKEIAAGKKRMIWGVVALFVIVSVWGLVALLGQLFGVQTTQTCPSPSIVVDGVPSGVQTCF